VILLDTNVISELMRPRPDTAALAWMARQSRLDIYTTSITKAEIFYGIAVLPEGRRKTSLASDAQRMFAEDFGGRVLPFDEDAAAHFAEIAAGRRRAGMSLDVPDMQIAAIALATGAAVATRNVGDFEGSGVAIIDPWAAP
jgi:predicted nucleic acid-binding protein